MHSILSTFSDVIDGGSSAAAGSVHFSLIGRSRNQRSSQCDKQWTPTPDASRQSCIGRRTSGPRNSSQKVRVNQVRHEEHSSSVPSTLLRLVMTARVSDSCPEITGRNLTLLGISSFHGTCTSLKLRKLRECLTQGCQECKWRDFVGRPRHL